MGNVMGAKNAGRTLDDQASTASEHVQALTWYSIAQDMGADVRQEIAKVHQEIAPNDAVVAARQASQWLADYRMKREAEPAPFQAGEIAGEVAATTTVLPDR